MGGSSGGPKEMDARQQKIAWSKGVPLVDSFLGPQNVNNFPVVENQRTETGIHLMDMLVDVGECFCNFR